MRVRPERRNDGGIGHVHFTALAARAATATDALSHTSHGARPNRQDCAGIGHVHVATPAADPAAAADADIDSIRTPDATRDAEPAVTAAAADALRQDS